VDYIKTIFPKKNTIMQNNRFEIILIFRKNLLIERGKHVLIQPNIKGVLETEKKNSYDVKEKFPILQNT